MQVRGARVSVDAVLPLDLCLHLLGVPSAANTLAALAAATADQHCGAAAGATALKRSADSEHTERDASPPAKIMCMAHQGGEHQVGLQLLDHVHGA